jgi:hypothetical protein
LPRGGFRLACVKTASLRQNGKPASKRQDRSFGRFHTAVKRSAALSPLGRTFLLAQKIYPAKARAAVNGPSGAVGF